MTAPSVVPGRGTPALEYADYILRYAATCPCLMELSGIDRDPRCECYGCAGRKYVAMADEAVEASRVEPALAVDPSWSSPDAAAVAPTSSVPSRDAGGADQ